MKINVTEIDVSSGMFDVISERARQIEKEGFSPGHDDGYTKQQLSVAAACYALVDYDPEDKTPWLKRTANMVVVHLWPWSATWWKPRGRRWNLVRAAALLVAEIERIDRLAEKEAGDGAS